MTHELIYNNNNKRRKRNKSSVRESLKIETRELRQNCIYIYIYICESLREKVWMGKQRHCSFSLCKVWWGGCKRPGAANSRAVNVYSRSFEWGQLDSIYRNEDLYIERRGYAQPASSPSGASVRGWKWCRFNETRPPSPPYNIQWQQHLLRENSSPFRHQDIRIYIHLTMERFFLPLIFNFYKNGFLLKKSFLKPKKKIPIFLPILFFFSLEIIILFSKQLTILRYFIIP